MRDVPEGWAIIQEYSAKGFKSCKLALTKKRSVQGLRYSIRHRRLVICPYSHRFAEPAWRQIVNEITARA